VPYTQDQKKKEKMFFLTLALTMLLEFSVNMVLDLNDWEKIKMVGGSLNRGREMGNQKLDPTFISFRNLVNLLRNITSSCQ